MTTQFERDFRRLHEDATAARLELMNVVRSLSDADLDRARRGGWTVRRALEHVTQSDRYYASMVARLRGITAEAPAIAASLDTQGKAVTQLNLARHALLSAIEGIDEEAFYRLETAGREEYSVMSVLENITNHDREHAEQLRAILESA